MGKSNAGNGATLTGDDTALDATEQGAAGQNATETTADAAAEAASTETASDPIDATEPAAPVIDEDRAREIFQEIIEEAISPERLQAMADEYAARMAGQITDRVVAATLADDRLKSMIADCVSETFAQRGENGTGNTQERDPVAVAPKSETIQAAAADAVADRDATAKAAVSTEKARQKELTSAMASAASDRVLALAGAGETIDLGEPMRLRFGDDTRFIPTIAPIDTHYGHDGDMPLFTARADQLVLGQDIDFDPQQPAATITEAWLIGEGGARRCEISGGLRVGGGAEAKLPAGHLAFLVS